MKKQLTFRTFSATCDLIFLNSEDAPNLTWEYVINCAAETRPGLADEIYKEGIYKLSVNCATAAARYGILKYVEISSGEISSSQKVSSDSVPLAV